MLESLTTEVRAEVQKYKQTADQKRALLSRLLQRTAVGNVFSIPLSDIEIRRTKGGKPFCANYVNKASAPNFNFNVSHEVLNQTVPGFLLCARLIAWQPKVGLCTAGRFCGACS